MTQRELRAVLFVAVGLATAAAAVGCTSKTEQDYRAEVVSEIHDAVAGDLAELEDTARDLQAAAPTRAWDDTTDAVAIARMRDDWKRGRTAYERAEGAIAPLFPAADAALDARYEEMLTTLGPAGDPDLFDGRGVIGMHAVERILFAPMIRDEVIEVERQLPGYRAAAYPATDDEAIAFKTLLVQRMVDTASTLRKQWQPQAIDIGASYRGLVTLMYQAANKVDSAVIGEEESRYANTSLFDMRNNLAGTQNVYRAFAGWVESKTAGGTDDAGVEHTFDRLATQYDTVISDAIPSAPSDWSPAQPTQADLSTPYGALWNGVHLTVDPDSEDSVVSEMNRIAALLGLPEFVEI